MDGTLYLGQKRYSSWSLRGWLAVRLAGLAVEEKVIRFTRPGRTQAIEQYSPSGLVPCLDHLGALVWESLAICEYCAEFEPSLWPAGRAARAHARAISSEMHAAFGDLRSNMWMNLGRDFAGLGRTPGALADVARIEKVWAETRARFAGGGSFLFGPRLTVADIMFAPVVTRFLTWRPDISADTSGYCASIRNHPLMVQWYDDAAKEPADWLVDDYERPR